MRSCYTLALIALAACGDDGGNQAPDTTLDSVPAAVSNKSHVELNFHNLGNANRFECTLDGDTIANCLPPFETELPDGPHTFTVAAALNQHVDDTPSMHAWTIDTVPPTTKLLAFPPPLDNSTSPVVTFEGADNRGVAVTFECSLDGAAFAACTSPVALATADGAHQFKVRAVDDAGNIDDTPEMVGWTVDTSAPDTTIAAGPAEGSTTATTGNFAFTSNDATATFECSTDGGAFTPCVSPAPFLLGNGGHMFAVRAVDTGGLRDPSPAMRGWSVDAIAPDVTITQGPANPSNVTAPTFMFSSTDATATFACSVDGGASTPCVSPFTSAALADGNHTFDVLAADAVGNQAGATFAWALDTVAPTVTITSAPAAASNDTTPTVAFTTAGGAVTIECAVDGGAFAACTSPFTSAALGDGNHQIAVRATDAAGNASAAMASFAIDTAPPTVMIVNGPGALTNDNTPTFTFTVAGATAVDCRVDTGAFAACTSPATTAALGDGSHTFTVRGTDAVGNQASASATFTVDTAPPSVTFTGQPAALSNDTTPTASFTTAGSPVTTECAVDGGSFTACTSPFTSAALADGSHTITVRVTDAAGNSASATTSSFAIDTVAPTVAFTSEPSLLSNDTTPTAAFTTAGAPTSIQCQVDAGAFAACTSPFTSAAVADGTHTITVKVADGAGNSSQSTTQSFVIDTVAPTVAITAQPAALSNNPAVAVSFTTAGGPTSVQCRLDASALAACTSPFMTTAADGAHTVTIVVADGANNSSSATTSSFTIDTVAPSVAFVAQPAALSNDNTPTVTFTTAGGATSIQCQVDAGTFAACTSPFTSSALADGTHTMTVRVTDAAGNSAQQTTSPFAIDTSPPTVTITSQPASPTNNPSAAVAFTTAGSPTSTTCRVDTGTAVACTSPFATAVADGTHTITVTVTDGAGNSGSASTSPFVVDTVPPSVTITGQPGANSNDTTPTVTFTTAGAPTSTQCSVDGGTFAACTSPFTSAALADGTHTITVKVADAAGNSAQQTTSPFVIDTQAPTVTITSQPSSPTNNPTAAVTFTTAGSPTSTQCRLDAGTLASCTSPFSIAVADGTHTITVVVTDAAGNSSSATTSSFVVDTQAPTVTITGQPAALSNDNTPTVTFTTAGGATSTSCRVDTGTTVACTSPFTPATAVADGAHTMTVLATDAAGNTGSATTSSFTVDTAPPVVTITAQPAALSNDNTPTVSFTVTGGTTIQCRVDAGTFATCTSPFTPAAVVVDGAHTITVQASDGAGNTGSATTSSFTIDTVPPTVTLTTQPASLSNDNTPTVVFTTAGSPTITQCRVDAGTFASCTSPFTATAVADGSHTITVRVQDGAGNSSSATTSSFVVDTTPPAIVFDDAPPAEWPVNYFDMRFHATETSTLTCSLNNAAFTSCATGLSITAPYNQLSTFVVRATDAAGNVGQASTQWTSADGLVLHYPWEQGRTQNTSLLSQNAAYSPHGSVAALPFLGGWAGTALGNTISAHGYAGTKRPLLSSENQGFYTASFWVRTNNDAPNGTVMSTLGAGGGFRVRMVGIGLTVDVFEPATGGIVSKTVTVGIDKWTHVALLATGPGKGLEIFVNGNLAGIVAAPTGTGFDVGQADLVVGNVNAIDLDDLRFFNKALSTTEICGTLARGFLDANFTCNPLSPGFELDFELDRVFDTGLWDLPLNIPQQTSFVTTKTGEALKVPPTFDVPWGYAGNFRANATAVPASVGRSFTLRFDATQPAFGKLIDMTKQCVVGGPPPICGISVKYASSGHLSVFTGTSSAFQKTTDVPFGVTGGLSAVAVTESRDAAGNTTLVQVFVNGVVAATIPVPSEDIYKNSADTVTLAERGMTVDEYAFWTKDLSKDPEALCENGFGGEFDPVDDSCALTSN